MPDTITNESVFNEILSYSCPFNTEIEDGIEYRYFLITTHCYEWTIKAILLAEPGTYEIVYSTGKMV